MGQIRRELYNSFPPADSNCDFIVTGNDVISVILKLNSGKSEGNGGVSTDHLKNACDDLFMYVSFLFSWMLVHDTVPDDLLTSNVIPFPKGNKKDQHRSCHTTKCYMLNKWLKTKKIPYWSLILSLSPPYTTNMTFSCTYAQT